MAVVSCIKYLNGGLFSDFLKARDEYNSSCRQLKNFIPSVQGPIVRRGGTKYLGDCTGAVRLEEFVFDPEQKYLLVFYTTKIDILYNDALFQSVPISYSEDDIPNLYITQVQDVMYIAHANYPLKQLVRSASGGVVTFSIADVQMINGPYMNENITATTFTFNSNQVTSSTSLFTANDVGRWIHMEVVESGTIKSWDCKISTFTSDTKVSVTDVTGTTSTAATKLWRMSPFSASNGYPEAVCLHQERLFLAKSGSVYAGQQSAGTDFRIKKEDGTVLDTHGFSCDLSNEKSGEIYWLNSAGGMLLVGCMNQINAVTSNAMGYAITPSNKKAIKAFEYGTCSTKAIAVDDNAIFVDIFRRTIQGIKYSTVYEEFSKDSLTAFNEDITLGKIKEIAYQSRKIPVLWCVKKSGQVIGCTISMKDKVVAWFENDFGGKVISIATMPNLDEERDDVYFLVEREINGQTKTYLEGLTSGLRDGEVSAENAFFVDCGFELDSPTEVKQITGLDHLEGKSVKVLADGAVHPDRVVENGTIDLQFGAKHIIVGIGYESILQPATIIPAEGTERSEKHISGIELMLQKTLGGKVGVANNMKIMPMRFANMDMDKAVGLFTGNYKVASGGVWSKDADVVIIQDEPLPMTVQAIYLTMEVAR